MSLKVSDFELRFSCSALIYNLIPNGQLISQKIERLNCKLFYFPRLQMFKIVKYYSVQVYFFYLEVLSSPFKNLTAFINMVYLLINNLQQKQLENWFCLFLSKTVFLTWLI